MMYLGPTGFMIASNKDNSGNWNWRTFGTGQGFVADLIVAGEIMSANGNVEFNLDNEYLKISHRDGSYSKLDINGIQHYIAGEAYPYFGLCTTGQISVPCSKNGLSQYGYPNTDLNCGMGIAQLPNEFKGKAIHAIAMLSSYDLNGVQEFAFVVQSGANVDAIDNTNAQLKIATYLDVRAYDSGSYMYTYGGDGHVSYIAIA